MSRQTIIKSYWEDEFYRKQFGTKINLNLTIPEAQGDFQSCVVSIGEITEEMLYEKCNDLFRCDEWPWRGWRGKRTLNESL